MAIEASKPRARAFQTRASWFVLLLCLLPSHVFAVVTATILAGGETDLPSDTPSGRLDAAGNFAFVGALEIPGGAGSFKGSAVAISRDWILTDGHNADLNDDRLPDVGWNATLPLGMGYPTLGKGAGLGDVITLVGYGRSGFGSYGYTPNASLTDRRYGSNVFDSFRLDDEGSGAFEVFNYDFDAPEITGLAGGSLGNDIETMIGPGDSSGAALRQTAEGWELVGINTFTEGYGGRFGDTGGGVLIEPYLGWIHQTTGIPEPGSAMLWALSAGWLI